jgi:hypothetical protein
MLPLIVILSAASGILLALAMRGRTAASGIFCQRCKFDLQGLDIIAVPTCPECGQPLDQPESTVLLLRRRSMPMLAAAVIFLIASAGLMTVSMAPTSKGLYANLPDSAIIHLNALGNDSALTEIAARSDIFPHFSKDHWDTLLARGLTHQADTSVPWDPRWGRILANAFLRQQMTQAQMTAYVENGLVARVSIRDRVRADRPEVGVRVQWTHERFHAQFTSSHGLGAGRASIYDVHHRIIRSGVIGQEKPAPTTGISDVQGIFMVPGGPLAETYFARDLIQLPNIIPSGPMREIRVFVEIETAVKIAGGGPEVVSLGPTRFEQTVVVLPLNTKIVGLVRDDAAAQTIRDAARISDVFITKGDPGASRMQLRLNTQASAVAGNLFAVVDGVETKIASQIRLASNASVLQIVTPTPIVQGRSQDTQRRMLEAWAQRGSMDFVFRTDPDAAYDDPSIDEVVDLTLWFRNIPVKSVQPDAPRPTHTFHAPQTPTPSQGTAAPASAPPEP